MVLREENGKSPRTAADICKSILEIPGISKMFWNETHQNPKMAAKNIKSSRKIVKPVEVFFVKTYPFSFKKTQKSGSTIPLIRG